MKLASLKDCSQKDLAQMAKQKGVPGWHDMRKDQLVRVLARLANAKRDKAKLARRPATGKASSNGASSNGHKSAAAKVVAKAASAKLVVSRLKPTANGHKLNGHKVNGAKMNGVKAVVANGKPSTNGHKSNGFATNGHKAAAFKSNGHKANGSAAAKIPAKKPVEAKRPVEKAPPPPKPKSPVVVEKIHKINVEREHLKDLSLPSHGKKDFGGPRKDRVVLLVRDPYWLHVCWELTHNSIQRAKAAMAEHWHTAKPILRLLEVGDGATTSSAERVARDIEIHGGVKNWYIDVQDPPKHYRVAVGYLAANGKFFALCRSNSITTPVPGSSDDVDRNWSDVARNYEKVYALSGGYAEEGTSGDLQELFEERLRRPMGGPIVARYGVGAERLLNRQREFRFDVEADLVVYGNTKPDAYVTLAGEPVKIRPDGTFMVRLGMPDKRQVLPIVASSGDGIEQRTVVIAVERNTKVMEPMIRDGNE